MEQKYYIAEKGSRYLSVTDHPGQLKENDVVNNIARMIQQDEEINLKEAKIRANEFYQENLERLLELVKPGMKLQEVNKEEAEEAMNLPFSEWEQSEFQRTEWD